MTDWKTLGLGAVAGLGVAGAVATGYALLKRGRGRVYKKRTCLPEQRRLQQLLHSFELDERHWPTTKSPILHYRPSTGLRFLIDTGAQVSVVYVNFIVSIMRCIRYYCCAFENAKISKIATNTTLCEVQGCNIPSGPIYISQLVRIGRTCSTYEEFVKRTVLVTSRLIKRGFLYVELVRSFKKFYIKYVSKCNVRTKRHVSEGICGLYDGLPSVYKFVTTRRPRLWTLMCTNLHRPLSWLFSVKSSL